MKVVNRIIACVACLGLVGTSNPPRKIRYPINRSYQVPFSVINGGQGLQYYSGTPIYTSVPTVLIPNQIGISAAQMTPVVVQSPADYKPVHEAPETSSLVQTTYKPVKYPVTYYKPKFRGVVYKRPSSFLNYVYSTPVKTFSGQKLSTISVQPSRQESEVQYQQQGAPSSVYQSTVGAQMGTPYSTGKVVEYVKKARVPSTSHQMYFRRVTGPGHRYPLYTSKKVYLSPKGHHHYPSKYFTHPKYHPVKYVATSSLPSTPTESPVYITSRPTQESTPSYTLNFGSEVRFPDDQESSKDSADDQKPRNTAPGDITRAIIRSPDVINNYDASLPIKVPRVKPFTFEVSDLIKNSDFHFAPGSQTVGQGAYEGQSSSDVLQYPQATSYQNAHAFGTHFATIPVNAGGGSSLDIYNMAGSSSYQSNQLTSGQDLESSKTVKIPVAVIKGAHDLTSTGLLGLPTMRQSDAVKTESKDDFTSSKRTSDWIPMSNGISLDVGQQESSNSPSLKVVRPRVEEIISGKIPQEFTPNLSRNDEGDIVTGKIPGFYSSGKSLGTDNGRKRTGSFVDLNSSSISDTSDLVVSSMIKFS
ncbi:hypothetical protein RUM43_001687 [Polyplax serrata]|uniref:Uncharacterized protein n=1 Tax=Polyplax serrata TaxID=468196 RepID=A0AAN8SK04_POLSC